LPYLNITEALWSVLENKVGCRFCPPLSLRQLEDVFHEVWYNIPLETILNFSISRWIQAVLQANGGLIPY